MTRILARRLSFLIYETILLKDGHLDGHDEQNDQVESFSQNLGELCVLYRPIYFLCQRGNEMSSYMSLFFQLCRTYPMI
jgi:hypothetical protein